MDGWSYQYPDVDPADMLPTLDQGWGAMEARRVRAQQGEHAGVAEHEQVEGLDAVGEAHALKGIPLPFATPAGAAPTF